MYISINIINHAHHSQPSSSTIIKNDHVQLPGLPGCQGGGGQELGLEVGKQHGIHGIFMGYSWDIHGIFMGYSWNFMGYTWISWSFMGISWDILPSGN